MKFILPLALALVVVAGCHPDLLEIRSQRRYYRQSFLHDERAPLERKDLKYLDFYPPDTRYRFHARFTLTPDSAAFELPTYSGITRTYRQYGTIEMPWPKAGTVRLAVYENIAYLKNPIYDDYLFLPFKDATNGKTTYGGGRYLNLSKSDSADGDMIVDFNACYNPWCAYSEGFNCPIPPKANHLSIPVPAGEKKYRGPVKPAGEH